MQIPGDNFRGGFLVQAFNRPWMARSALRRQTPMRYQALQERAARGLNAKLDAS